MNEPTSSHHKVKNCHLQREAYLYVRQSSMRQVLENTESTKRQYELRERALALGWQGEQIRIIDCDQGRSGATDAGRDGFQQLVAEVSLGNAGIVMGLEVSRLARNNADWHRLLQLCAFTDSLILDQDGLYDPGSFNDRLLLGLKGAMSEAELHVLRTRLQEGILNKARRGELKVPLPVGFVYDELDRVILTPDKQVREVLRRFFDSFQRLGSAFAVVREFRREDIEVPHYSRTGPKSCRVIWGDLSHPQALRILHNPRYAGAFSFGRIRSRRGPDGRVRYEKLPQDQWSSLVCDCHEGYISWNDYQRNQETLRSNAQAYSNERSPTPREGPALLQGLVICGVCGKGMTVRYHQRHGELVPDYKCQRDKIEKGHSHDCQSIPGSAIDCAVSELLQTMISEQAVDISLAVRKELQARLDEADRLRRQHVERCRYEADLARRRYLAVDPDKRYVAEVLEAEWNEKLRDLDQSQIEYEQARSRDQKALGQAEINSLYSLPDRFGAIWDSETLTHRDRKRIVRLLISDVTLIRNGAITMHIRFNGGTSKTMSLPAPQCSWETWQTSKEVINTIDELLEDHPEYKIVALLNERKLKTGKGKSFNEQRVLGIRIANKLPTRSVRLRKRGMLNARELGVKLAINPSKIRKCGKLGLLHAHEYSRGKYLYEEPGPDLVKKIPQLARHART